MIIFGIDNDTSFFVCNEILVMTLLILLSAVYMVCNIMIIFNLNVTN